MSDDPFEWLEDVDGAAALAWVRGENARSLAALEADPRHQLFYDAALAVVTARDRISYPSFRGAELANFWQDDAHVRGLWRETSLASYLTEAPRWTTVLDVDALAAAEGRNWVYHGGTSLPPERLLALVALSDGGKDAAEWREFDTAPPGFVEGGFALPEGKQNAAWLDRDSLLVGRDWGEGTTTASGYPFVLKRVRRGVPLDAAEEVFRGAASDVAVRPAILRDPDGALKGVLVFRAVTFFETENYLLEDPLGDAAPVQLALPRKAQFRDFVAGHLVFTLDEEWRLPGGEVFGQGALISLDLKEARRDPQALRPLLIYQPGERETIESVAATRSILLVTLYRNVQAVAIAYRFAAGGWIGAPLDLPANATIAIVATSERDERAFVDAAGFLNPNTLFLADLSKAAAPEAVKAAPARFDPSPFTVEQFEAVSADGTMVPYFVVRPRALAFDGTAPTLLYGYGGFQISLTPSYIPVVGKLWLERGGVYAIANIRGGGEFGPGWHQAALKDKRQRAFDDFIAVAEDLIGRGITAPRRLGIMGGSNGGLLMGVMLTQRPDLFHAVAIEVPLLDMLRYHRLLAGASWVAEYGDPDDPAEAAFLAQISPYHNLRDGAAYPEPFFVTSTKDDRVHPGHARKMAAKMAAMGLPFLYYENIDGGHAAAANLVERARRHALEFTYLARKLMD